MSDDHSHLAQLQAHASQCLRTVDQVAGELRALASRLLPVIDEVERVIGGTAQGTDAQMVSSLDAAAQALQRALDSCGHARSMTQRLRSSL